MPLSCSCVEPDDDNTVWYWQPDDYSLMPARSRRARCSCGSVIEPAATVAAFRRTRGPRGEYEERRFGYEADAVPLATVYLCERCADLYWSLYELGYECLSPHENMLDLVKEYAAIHRPQPARTA